MAVLSPVCVLIGLLGAMELPDEPSLDSRVVAVSREHGDGVEAGIWVGELTGNPAYTRKADAILPSASAIKTAFLIELFAKYAETLDQPPEGLDAVLVDTHPAVAHFTPAQREEIRKGFAGASVRKLGGIMMGSVPASNIVYNAAANAVTALLGGPEALTAKIRARHDDPRLALAVRRYMLAPRNVTGDNEASPAALATVLRKAATIESVRAAMLTVDNHLGLEGRHHVKEGALDTDPLARVQSGLWKRPDGKTWIYVIMLTQPTPGKLPRDKASERLDATSRRVAKLVVETAAGLKP